MWVHRIRSGNRAYNFIGGLLHLTSDSSEKRYFNEHAKTCSALHIFSDTHRNQPKFNVNDTLNGCTMHQVLSYWISKLYPWTLLYSRAELNNVRAPKSWLYFASLNFCCSRSLSNISWGCKAELEGAYEPHRCRGQRCQWVPWLFVN